MCIRDRRCALGSPPPPPSSLAPPPRTSAPPPPSPPPPAQPALPALLPLSPGSSVTFHISVPSVVLRVRRKTWRERVHKGYLATTRFIISLARTAPAGSSKVPDIRSRNLRPLSTAREPSLTADAPSWSRIRSVSTGHRVASAYADTIRSFSTGHRVASAYADSMCCISTGHSRHAATTLAVSTGHRVAKGAAEKQRCQHQAQQRTCLGRQHTVCIRHHTASVEAEKPLTCSALCA
eukprot:3358421-Rhodomonas_salina.9